MEWNLAGKYLEAAHNEALNHNSQKTPVEWEPDTTPPQATWSASGRTFGRWLHHPGPPWHAP